MGLIAGGGQFPILFARAARERGWQIHAAAYKDETYPDLNEYVTTLEWFYVGQIKKLIRYFHSHRITQAVIMGSISKTRMFKNVRPDTRAIALIAG